MASSPSLTDCKRMGKGDRLNSISTSTMSFGSSSTSKNVVVSSIPFHLLRNLGAGGTLTKYFPVFAFVFKRHSPRRRPTLSGGSSPHLTTGISIYNQRGIPGGDEGG